VSPEGKPDPRIVTCCPGADCLGTPETVAPPPAGCVLAGVGEPESGVRVAATLSVFAGPAAEELTDEGGVALGDGWGGPWSLTASVTKAVIAAAPRVPARPISATVRGKARSFSATLPSVGTDDTVR
jgi:hypothetical protein